MARPAACTSAPAVASRRPYREASRGPASEPIRNVTHIGTSVSPAADGPIRRPSCNATARTNMKPPQPMENGMISVSPLRTACTRSSDGGTSGTRPARSSRRSTTTNATAATGKSASSTHDHSGHPAARPSVSGTSSDTSERDSRAVPQPSTPAGRSERVSGTARTASSRAAAAIGALIRKMDRQPVPARSAETSTPPSTCPTALTTPAVPLYRLSAFVRCAPLVVAWIVASTCGSISADAAPCATRATTSVHASGARPQATDVTPKAAVPHRNSRLRPTMSPS
ncbi:hypothetical protein GCM10020000_56030 [Streptomyces olivoverticillatus]